MAIRRFGLFEAMPSELVLQIMENSGVRGLSALVVTNKWCYELFKANQATVMSNVLLQQPELEAMLFIHTMDNREFNPGAMLHPRTINFDPGRDDEKLVNFVRSPVAFKEGKLICPRKICFGMADIIELWNMIKTIDWWVEEYPRLRWRESPEDCRCLRPSEELRLRKAVARWWLYSHCFHGNYWREAFLPQMWEIDGRLQHIRLLTSVEIRELQDLWDAVRTTVSRDLCSSVDRNLDRDGYFAVVPWGYEEGRQDNIVFTYMKLDPAQLTSLIERGRHLKQKRQDIVRETTQLKRQFSLDVETLHWSIGIVLQERVMVKCHSIMEIPPSGIIDEDSFVDKDGVFTTDAWPTGKPPLSPEEISSFPVGRRRYVGFGDDGGENPEEAYIKYGKPWGS